MRSAVTQFCVITLLITGCRGFEAGSDPAQTPRAPPDPSTNPNTPDPDAAVWFATMCASCHGERGQGGIAPRLDRWTKPRADLVASIDERMPTGNPDACKGDCATALTDLILLTLQTTEPEPAPCTEVGYPPVQLRLLTRREYDNTIRDLFRPTPRACSDDSQCNLRSESCDGAACVRDPCGRHTFVYEPSTQPTSVAIAGSFNAWTPAPMQPRGGVWVSKIDLPDGEHQYKLVTDGSNWIADPSNSLGTPDGFGGSNSVVRLDCAGATPPATLPPSPSSRFPPESRPEGYAYDNSAEGGVLTAVHVTEHLDAAEAIADGVAEGLAHCSPSGACAESIVDGFGPRAFRRPLSADERAKYVALIQGRTDFIDGISAMVQAMLTSPFFLYRFEIGQRQADGSHRLDAYEVASALSYTFWGTMPDALLFEAAGAGRLDGADGIEVEARRLLADPRARDNVATFAAQWLGVESIVAATKSRALGSFEIGVREAMLEEVKRLVTHVVFDGSGALDDLFTADFTFANAELARFYGASVGGDGFSQVRLQGRAGVLGLGGVMASYAYSDQSSPVRRGLFVRSRLLCQELPAPPPNAGGIPEVDPSATTRERFAQHSSDPACRACHQYIDPVGFGFEQFDALGRWRDTDAGKAIDASGRVDDVEAFGDGTSQPFATLPELATILAQSNRARTCFTTQFYRFARGGLEAEAETCAIERLSDQFAADGEDIRSLMIRYVRSDTFVVRSP